MYFLHTQIPEGASYNVAFAARIISRPDINALRKSFQRLVNRHAALRTTYKIKDGIPVQEVHTFQEIFFEVIEATDLNEDELTKKVKETYRIPFDLENGPLFKVYLFKISDDNFVLLINMHHIASDGWSLGIILREAELFYLSETENKEINLPAFKMSYTDYIKKQDEMLNGQRGTELWNFWEKELEGCMTSVNLPFDKPKTSTVSNRGSMVHIGFDRELTLKLRAFAKSEGVTLYTLLLTAFFVLIHKYSNQADILIGSSTAGRNISDTKDLVGYFVSPVVMRGKFYEEKMFKTFLNEVRKTVLDALQNQDFPFPLLVEKMIPQRIPGTTPIFQIEFGLYKINPGEPILSLFESGNFGKKVLWGNMEVEYFEMTQQEGQFEMLMELTEGEEIISGYLKYKTDLFREETISRIARRYKTLLENILRNPDQKISEIQIFEETKYSPIKRIEREAIK